MQHEADENESIMDHCALECMRAIESKDKDTFKQSFHVLVRDVFDKLSKEMEQGE